MKFTFLNEAYEARTQTRLVTTTDVFYKGRKVASGSATCAPEDAFDQTYGERLATARAFGQLGKDYLKSVDLPQLTLAQASAAVAGNPEANIRYGATTYVSSVAIYELGRTYKNLLDRLAKRKPFFPNMDVFERLFDFAEHWADLGLNQCCTQPQKAYVIKSMLQDLLLVLKGGQR